VRALAPRAEKKVRIIQTNSAGDNVHVIDPVTNKVVGVIEGIEVNHGAAVAPDGSRIYVSNEGREHARRRRRPVAQGRRPREAQWSPEQHRDRKDGKKVYVGIIQAPGGVDVIDTAAMKNLKTLQTRGSIHNAYVTPDGKYVVPPDRSPARRSTCSTRQPIRRRGCWRWISAFAR